MMVIRATDTELDISGSLKELDALAYAVVDFARVSGRQGGAVMAYFAEGREDPRPYDRCLAQLVVSLVDAAPVRVVVARDEVKTGSGMICRNPPEFGARSVARRHAGR